MSTHKKSTLPSLLDLYLQPEDNEQCDRGQKSRQQKAGKETRKLTPLDEDEEDLKVKATRKALQEQRHLEAYKNMYRLWNAMKLQYMDLLSKKVQRQRHEIKERDLQFQCNIEEQERKQNTTRRLFGQQSEFPQLCHEIKYLKTIPKSHFYMGGLPGLPTFQHINHPVSKQRKVQEETEQMFPKVMVPHLSAFQMISTKQSNTQTLIDSRPKSGKPGMRSLKKVPEKPYHREEYLDKLYQMYRHSFANMVEAQRQLERSGHFMEYEEPSIQDFMFNQEIDATEKITQSQRTSIGSFLTLSAPHACEEPNSRSLEESENQDETSGGINAEAASHKLKQSWNQVPPDPVNVYVPLNIEDILPNNYIVEAKRPSGLWTNYVNIRMRETKGFDQSLSTEYCLNTAPILVNNGDSKGCN
ncbi:uncharacterized protein [Scyliorhinus torazame]|uniref:uncharacterized protein isoform X3 n=1 Tax=Scyliorhinus torazame TaxID=75743 RepID=UPI003B5A28D2